MNEEIKEIIERLHKNYESIKDSSYYPDDVLGSVDLIILIDYIDKLQQENKELKEFKDRLLKSLLKAQIDMKRQNPATMFDAGGIAMLVSIMEEIKKIEGDK